MKAQVDKNDRADAHPMGGFVQIRGARAQSQGRFARDLSSRFGRVFGTGYVACGSHKLRIPKGLLYRQSVDAGSALCAKAEVEIISKQSSASGRRETSIILSIDAPLARSHYRIEQAGR